MATYSKSDICNMALSNLGLANNIVDIDDPTNQTERVFSQFYNIVLSKVLKRERPQFAIYDDVLTAQEFGDHTWHFMQAPYMLEVLRVNGMLEGWTIEHGEIFPRGMQIKAPTEEEPEVGSIDVKYLRLIEDTGLMTNEFVELFAWELAVYCCGRLTQDVNMMQLAMQGATTARQEYQTINLRSAKPKLKTQDKFNAIWRR